MRLFFCVLLAENGSMLNRNVYQIIQRTKMVVTGGYYAPVLCVLLKRSDISEGTILCPVLR